MLAPHAVDIAVTISSLIASLCLTFAEPFNNIFLFVRWSCALVTGNTNKSLRPKEGSNNRPSEWICARSLTSYFAFCKIVVKIDKHTNCKVQVTASWACQRKQATSCSGSWRKWRWCFFWSERIWQLQSSCTSKKCMVVFISLHFGFLARDESHRLHWGDIQLQPQNEGQEILVQLGEWGTKTQLDQKKVTKEHSNLSHQYREMSSQLLKKFHRNWPVEMNTLESLFYLVVWHNRSSNGKVWYMMAPLTKWNWKVSLYCSKECWPSARRKRVTNHSVRKTCISRLLDADTL